MANSMTNNPPILITPGEPAGIGPDLIIKIAQQPQIANLVVVADSELLAARAKQLNLPLKITFFKPELIGKPTAPSEIKVMHVPLNEPCVAGIPSKHNATYVIETLNLAIESCMHQQFGALVTGPVHKGIINEGGIHFRGHTELLGELTHSKQVVMLLVAGEFRVALVTTHLPLAEVPKAITTEALERVIRVLDRDLRSLFGLENPRILVCGLNPHAGDNGYLGHEENEIIIPALKMLRAEGLNLEGPLPADTIFTPQYLANADVVLAMYHDQGLPVLKHAAFGNAVNVTLGLPIIRTSVDHGTAFDIAGTGKADPQSMLAAIAMAQELIHRSRI